MPTARKTTRRTHEHEHSSEVEAFFESLAQFHRAWVVPYWRHALIGLCLILVVLAAVQTARSRRRAQNAEAFLALKEAEDIDELKGVAEDFPQHVAGVQANINVARKLFEEGKYDQAATRFALAAEAAGAADLQQAARLGEAYALEAQGKHQVAEKRFAALADDLVEAAAAVDATIAAGRCAAAQKKFAEAEKWYTKAAAIAKGETSLERLAEDALTALNTKRYASAPPKPEASETAESKGDAEEAQDAPRKEGDAPPKEPEKE